MKDNSSDLYLNPDLRQKTGNAIIEFKTSEEIERAKVINEEVQKIKEIASESLDYQKFEKISRIIKQDKKKFYLENLDAFTVVKSKKELIENALKVVCDNLNIQTAAIFIVSKEGVLERVGIYGYDRYGKLLNNESEWFEEEKYEIGIGFTGRTIKSEDHPKSNYGKIQSTEIFNDEQLNPEYKEKYLEKFGDLISAVSIPLNGRNRTCGVLRVINKIDRINLSDNSISLLNNPFTKEDINILLFLATNIANILSNFRRDIELKTLQELSRLLIHPFSYQTKEMIKNTYKKILNLLIENPENCFKAAILRVKDDNNKSLKVEAKSLADNVKGKRDNSSRNLDDKEFLWVVVQEKKRLIFQDIRQLINDLQEKKQSRAFLNQDWILKNNFKSFACFPLLVKDDVVGTLTLYGGYEYDPHTIDFLQGVADLLSSFIFGLKCEMLRTNVQNDLTLTVQGYREINIDQKQLELKFNKLAEEWRSDTVFISSTLQMSMHPAYQQIIGLGNRVVPLLLKEFAEKKEPDHWFWALNAITGENPIAPEQRGILSEMKKAWLEWGEKKGYVF